MVMGNSHLNINQRYPVENWRENLNMFNPYTAGGKFVNTKFWKKTEKWLKPCHMGTHLRVLSVVSEHFSMNTNMTGLR